MAPHLFLLLHPATAKEQCGATTVSPAERKNTPFSFTHPFVILKALLFKKKKNPYCGGVVFFLFCWVFFYSFGRFYASNTHQVVSWTIKVHLSKYPCKTASVGGSDELKKKKDKKYLHGQKKFFFKKKRQVQNDRLYYQTTFTFLPLVCDFSVWQKLKGVKNFAFLATQTVMIVKFARKKALSPRTSCPWKFPR